MATRKKKTAKKTKKPSNAAFLRAQWKKGLATARETITERDHTINELQEQLTKARANLIIGSDALGNDLKQRSEENNKLRKVLRIIRDLIDMQLGSPGLSTALLIALSAGAMLPFLAMKMWGRA